MKHLFYFFYAFLFPALLCACAPYGLDDHRAGICNELNSKLIFHGNTSITRAAEISNAEQPLVKRDYDKKC